MASTGSGPYSLQPMNHFIKWGPVPRKKNTFQGSSWVFQQHPKLKQENTKDNIAKREKKTGYGRYSWTV